MKARPVTSDDYRRLATVRGLPEAARPAVAYLIHKYRAHRPRRQPPHMTRDALAAIAARAAEILRAIADPDVAAALRDSHLDHRDPYDARQRLKPMDFPPAGRLALDDYRASLTRLREWADAAARAVPRAKPGNDAVKVRELIAALSAVMLKHAGRCLSRAKAHVGLAHDVARIADPDITQNAVRGAIDALRRPRRGVPRP